MSRTAYGVRPVAVEHFRIHVRAGRHIAVGHEGEPMSVGEDQAGAAVQEEPELLADAVEELEPATDDVYQALDDPAAEEDEDEVEGFEVSTDSLQLFLKDVGKVDLLTAAQEV